MRVQLFNQFRILLILADCFVNHVLVLSYLLFLRIFKWYSVFFFFFFFFFVLMLLQAKFDLSLLTSRWSRFPWTFWSWWVLCFWFWCFSFAVDDLVEFFASYCRHAISCMFWHLNSDLFVSRSFLRCYCLSLIIGFFTFFVQKKLVSFRCWMLGSGYLIWIPFPIVINNCWFWRNFLAN